MPKYPPFLVSFQATLGIGTKWMPQSSGACARVFADLGANLRGSCTNIRYVEGGKPVWLGWEGGDWLLFLLR